MSALTSVLVLSVHSSKDAKIPHNGATGPTKETAIVLKSVLLLMLSYIHGCNMQHKLWMYKWTDIAIYELYVISNFLCSWVSQRNAVSNHITVVTCSYNCLLLSRPVYYSVLTSLQNSCNGQWPKTHIRTCHSCVKSAPFFPQKISVTVKRQAWQKIHIICCHWYKHDQVST